MDFGLDNINSYLLRYLRSISKFVMMKIKVSKTVQSEVEIKLPAYYSNSCHTYKIVSDEVCIQVCDLGGHLGINMVSPSLPFTFGMPKGISESQFRDKFLSVNKILSDLQP